MFEHDFSPGTDMMREGPCVHGRFEMELASRLRNVEVWRVEDEDKQSPEVNAL